MISEPLTLKIGEERESAIEIGFKSGGYYGRPDPILSYVSGIAFHLIVHRVALSVSDDFKAAELSFNDLSVASSAMHIEAGYNFGWGIAAINYQSTDEALALELPET